MRKLALGFTLIELLVVISIIGILATLVAANLNSARARARDAQRKSDIKNISTALRLYFNDKGSFPAAVDIPWGAEWKSAGDTVYMSTVPKDPLSPNQDYFYSLGGTGDTFTLAACLENASDGQGKPVSGITCPTGEPLMFQISQ